MKYRVNLMQTVIEEAWITVDAENENEAMEKAPDMAIALADNDRTLEWSFYDTVGGIEAVQVKVES